MTWDPNRVTSSNFTGGARCADCGKIRFLTRKAAKHAAKNLNRRRPGHLNAYQCGEFWHIGHLPAAVIAGNRTRAELDATPPRHMNEKTTQHEPSEENQ